MQLFILDYDPELVPGMLCDAHLRKMCLETAQILSSVLLMQGKARQKDMPKPYNPKHPVIRALDSDQKINWAAAFNSALHAEYLRRFGKPHAYAVLCRGYEGLLHQPGIRIDPDGWNFARAFKGITITEPDIVAAYRKYYRHKKRLLIGNWNYTRTEEPDWLRTEIT